MKFSIGLVAIFIAIVFGQTAPVCTAALARTDECADVINANACYNQDRFKGAATLQCIDGKDNADKARKVGFSH